MRAATILPMGDQFDQVGATASKRAPSNVKPAKGISANKTKA